MLPLDAGALTITHACTSAGTRELGRPDVTGVPAACIGNVLPDWPDETYWNISCQAVKDILTKVSCWVVISSYMLERGALCGTLVQALQTQIACAC